MQQKILGTFIITLFLAETFFIYPNVDFSEIQDSKDSVLVEQKFIPDNVNELLTNTPVAFTENRGQLGNDEVRFYDQGGSVWFTDDGVWFELREYAVTRGQESGIREQGDFDPRGKFEPPVPFEYKSVVIKQEFVGANLVKSVGKGRLNWNSNFFYENDSSKWRTQVPNYQDIYYENLWDGIDLRYYTNENCLKYDFIVHPGGDPNDIRLSYSGGNLNIDSFGNIVLHTSLGIIIDSELFIYQNHEMGIGSVEGKFKLLAPLTYGFQILGNYDKSMDLIIDPIVYSTFIGGKLEDIGEDIAIDTDGNIYLTGTTYSSNFPNTTGANDTSYNGRFDVFVLKINPQGSSLVFSTYIGGSMNDYGQGIAIDSNGNSFITGYTQSSDFPNTTGALNNTNNGVLDLFVIKLNSMGSLLIFSTYIGGNSYEFGYDIAIDTSGNSYITGYTHSPDFPNTTGAYDQLFNGSDDIFILKLNSAGSALIFSTFIGGNSFEQGKDIAVDSENNVYITGFTDSNDFPNTTGAFDRKYHGAGDTFALKLNPTGSAIIYSTFIGGIGGDIGYGITIDTNGRAYITGQTISTDFPITPNAYNSTRRGVFILLLDKDGAQLVYSTFIGIGIGTSIAIDSEGNAYVTGYTNSINFPITSNADDTTPNGGDDGFIVKLNPTGSKLLYSTYLGGMLDDYGKDILIDVDNRIYITGETGSFDFPNTTGSYNNKYNGGKDGFIFKLRINTFPSVLDLQISESRVLRTKLIYLFSNATDNEELEENLTPNFQYRDPNNQEWNNTYLSNIYYNNSRWEVKLITPKNMLLGVYDFRVRFNDSDGLFSNWFYLNDSLTVQNNYPIIQNIQLSKNKAKVGEELSIWINGLDIEESEGNLTIELEYKAPNGQFWQNNYFENPKYLVDTWEIIFNISLDAPFGYYDFRARLIDVDLDKSTWIYANNSILVFNSQPKVIDIKLSKSSIYRTDSVFLYVNGEDHETSEDSLNLFAQYRSNNDDWISLNYEYSDLNNRWEIEFNTDKSSTLGEYDFRVKFMDNLNLSSGWSYLNNSLNVLNNIPNVIDIKVSKSNILRTRSLIIYFNGTDIEDQENSLKSEIQIRSLSGKWTTIDKNNFITDHWENHFTPSINEELGLYDIRINFTDLDGGSSSWKIMEGIFEVINNPPVISNLCDNFNVSNKPKEIDLTQFESDIEDSNKDLIWNIDQNSIDKKLFSAFIIDNLEDTLRILPEHDIIGSDDITLILTDKDRGSCLKSNVTIFINSTIGIIHGVEIFVSPEIIEIYPGKTKKVNLTIINKGNFPENFTIYFEPNNFTSDEIKFEKEIFSLKAGNLKNNTVTIIIPKDFKIDKYNITFTVKSNYVSDNCLLTVIIKGKEEKVKDEDNNTMFFLGFWIILMVIFILSIIIFHLFFRKKSRQKVAEKEKETLEKPNSYEQISNQQFDDYKTTEELQPPSPPKKF